AVKVRVWWERRDPPFRAPANGAGQIERRRSLVASRIRPMLEAAVFLEFVNQSRQPLRHRCTRRLKAIALETVQVLNRCGQLTHYDNEFILDREDLLLQKRIARIRSSETERRV